MAKGKQGSKAGKKAAAKKSTKGSKPRRGRPKGSKNIPKHLAARVEVTNMNDPAQIEKAYLATKKQYHTLGERLRALRAA